MKVADQYTPQEVVEILRTDAKSITHAYDWMLKDKKKRSTFLRMQNMIDANPYTSFLIRSRLAQFIYQTEGGYWKQARKSGAKVISADAIMKFPTKFIGDPLTHDAQNTAWSRWFLSLRILQRFCREQYQALKKHGMDEYGLVTLIDEDLRRHMAYMHMMHAYAGQMLDGLVYEAYFVMPEDRQMSVQLNRFKEHVPFSRSPIPERSLFLPDWKDCGVSVTHYLTDGLEEKEKEDLLYRLREEIRHAHNLLWNPQHPLRCAVHFMDSHPLILYIEQATRTPLKPVEFYTNHKQIITPYEVSSETGAA